MDVIRVQYSACRKWPRRGGICRLVGRTVLALSCQPLNKLLRSFTTANSNVRIGPRNKHFNLAEEIAYMINVIEFIISFSISIGKIELMISRAFLLRCSVVM